MAVLMNGRVKYWGWCCSRCDPKRVRRKTRKSAKRYEERAWKREVDRDS